jgi:hypothetical protein
VTRPLLILVFAAAAGFAQGGARPVEPEPEVEFICPMDRDVRNKGPGKCPRCGMKLTANLPEHVEYPMQVTTVPRVLRAGQPALLKFAVFDPKTGSPVTDYEVVHEKLFHLFIMSEDLAWFDHVHPQPGRPGEFVLAIELPKPGAYRLAADFFPAGGTPQFLPRTLITAGADVSAIGSVPALGVDLGPKSGANLGVTLTTEPPQPLAGQETLLFVDVSPAEGLEPYLGAWGHLLAASDDTIDLIHDHPLYVDGVEPPALDKPWPSRIQFNLLFPRERTYRVWVQFQRLGVLNTVAFTLPVKALR